MIPPSDFCVELALRFPEAPRGLQGETQRPQRNDTIASFYKLRSKYGGMDASMISQMKALEDQNRRLRKMYAEMSMQAELLKEALGKK